MAKILIIEDDPYLLRLMSIVLVKERHDLITATNGGEGIQAIKEEHLDLVITELMLPKVNGREVLWFVNFTEPNLPVILISGELTEPNLIEEDGSMLKPDGILSKPFSISQFVRSVRRSITRSGTSRITRTLTVEL